MDDAQRNQRNLGACDFGGDGILLYPLFVHFHLEGELL